MSTTSKKVEALLSLSLSDWAVTDAEQGEILSLLFDDPDLSRTINDLRKAGMLGFLIYRVDVPNRRGRLLQLLGGQLDAVSAATARTAIEKVAFGYTGPGLNLWVFDRCHQLQTSLRAFGVRGTTVPRWAWLILHARTYAAVLPKGVDKPFSGVGATGVSPTSLSVPAGDSWRLWRKDAATVQKYSNPLTGLGTYLASLTAAEKTKQAQLLLRQPISSIYPFSYGRRLPTRAEVMAAAAKEHDLHPQLLAAFVLAEQRDQTQLEDAKDYAAAVSVKQANTSIGLGQVVVSTARRNDLFSDLLDKRERDGLNHHAIATHLASDEFNIFAAAKYIRQVADEGAGKSLASLPNTRAKFPGIDLPKYALNSKHWPDDNIRALGSEYTSRAWDDSLSPGWGEFVFAAYKDVKASGVF